MYKRGETLTFAVFGLAALAALGFLVLSVVKPEGLNLRQTAPTASSTITTTPTTTTQIQTQVQTQTQVQNTGRIDRNGDPIQTVAPNLCNNRCSTAQECVRSWECASCALDENGKPYGECPCGWGYRCASK